MSTNFSQYFIFRFAGKTVVEHTELNCRRQSIKQDEYVCHVLIRADKLGAVLIADKEYPKSVAHTLITKVLDDFRFQVPCELWSSATESSLHFTGLHAYLSKYQDPREADPLTKIQTDLDETKIVLQQSIDAVLQRGMKLEELIAASENISNNTKTFYSSAKKTNSRCNCGSCCCIRWCCCIG